MFVSKYFGVRFGLVLLILTFFIEALPICAAIAGQTLWPASHLEN
jgi:hypothetical protein